jgi:hypothetical protein
VVEAGGQPKNSTKNLLEIINTFSKVTGYKVILQKSVNFQYINNEKTVKKYMKIIAFKIESKKLPRNKLHKGCERPLQ